MSVATSAHERRPGAPTDRGAHADARGRWAGEPAGLSGPAPGNPGAQRAMVFVAWAAVAAVAATDARTPLGFAHGTLFVIGVLAAAASERPRVLAAVAVAAVVLTFVGLLTSAGSASGVEPAHAIANRIVSALVIVGSAALATWQLGAVAAMRRARDAHARTVEVLERSNRLIQIAGETAHLGGWSVDLATQRATWSDEVARIHGKPSGFQPSVQEGVSFYHPDDRATIASAVEACASRGIAFDVELRLQPEGAVEDAWVRATGRAVRDGRGAIVAVEGAFQDVSERVRARFAEEMAARHARALTDRLAQTLEAISDAFFTLDRDWRITYVNPQAERLVRRRSEELIGVEIWSAFPGVPGSAFEHAYREVAETGEPRTVEAYYEPLGSHFEVRAFKVADGLALYFSDVTERWVIDQKKLHAQRLESIGQLTGGVAHDFNNLLTVIGGNADLLRERRAADPLDARLAGMIAEAATRGAELTRALLAFARRQALEPRATDVVELVRGLEPLLHRTLGEAVEVLVDAVDGVAPTFIDPHQLESSLLNLAINARDAMPDGGRLTIEVCDVVIDADYAARAADVEPGDYVLLAVSDTGVGIAADDLERVFEPFFTTKPVGRGSGLGLAMVHGFVKQSKGHVTIYSEPGEGTTLRLYLPRHVGPEAVEPRSTPSVDVLGGTETVLVVEDDAMVRTFAASQLRELGYVVLEAVDGATALATLRQRDDIALLFTDVVMPGGIGGKELAETALRLRPDLMVLFTSGYTENAIVHHGRLDPGVELLSKPYRRHDLARRVRQVLDARPNS